MERIAFRGRVLPSIVEITLDSVPRIDTYSAEADLHMAITIVVLRSAIEVIIDTDVYRDSDIAHFYRRAFDLAQAAIDTVAFSTGFSLTIYFDHILRPDGILSPLLFQNPELSGISTSFRLPVVTQEDRESFAKILSIVFKEPPLFMALNDAIKATSVLHHGPTNCGRVIDGLRKIVAPTLEAKKGWPVLQEIINCDEPYIKWISEISKNPRHGDRSFISGPDTLEVIRRTWIIMNRFLEYRKRENKLLHADEFPILKG